jgi:hypothetical protein
MKSDKDYTTRALAELDALLAECGPLADRVHDQIRQRMG